MMNDVLLIYPAYEYPRKSPPLGLAYLSGYIEKSGFKPHIIDFNINKYSDISLQKLLMSRQWILTGISFMTSQFAEASRLADIIKRSLPKVPLIAGGPHPSSIPERTLKEIPDIDIVVKGEGEITLIELLKTIRDKRQIDNLDGIVFRKKDLILSNPSRDLITDLDLIPFPSWKYFDISDYNVFSISNKKDSPVFALLSSRGCPNQCTFCDSHTIFKRKFRARSAENIFDEIMYLNKTYGMLEFDFVDDLITIQKKRILELCELIRTSDVPFRWMANARVNTVDREMLQAMKDAGCIRVDFGVETGDQHVRKLMRKNISDEQARNAHYIAHDVGLATGTFTMVGNLGETKHSVNMTVDLLNEFGDDVMVSIACPYPGTELYRIAKEKGFINTEDWTRYVTSPTYTPNYYPVMRTEHLSEDEILESFYYLHSFFVRRKFRRRFGRYFFINPRFFREWIFKPEGRKQRLNMAARLLTSRLRNYIFKLT